MPSPEQDIGSLLCGEVRTALLQSSVALPSPAAAQLLRLRSDDRVGLSERPNLHARSPDLLTGVDCRLPSARGSRVRCIGTVQTRACLTEGRVLQATAHFRVPTTGAGHRLSWSHYLARPGTVEPVGRMREQDVADGFLSGKPVVSGTVDPGAVAERLLGDIAAHPLLDRRAPFKSRRTQLRWAALPAEAGTEPEILRFTLADDGLRMLCLRLPPVRPAALAAFCEDIALHDWLLTTLVHMVERSRLGSAPGHEAVVSLRPAIDQLLHLWMPKARVVGLLAPLWDVLEREPGFSRQWQTLVQRIRDQLALQAIPLLREALAP